VNGNNSVQFEDRAGAYAAPLAIEPRKVAREATVYLVFLIE
jgi:hypothetical protein